ncbi:histidine kinase [Actinomycetospora sp. CA-101289]|uniref:PAS domain-containing sensor histidine kinase n=1 Tax=Actinomycetospora sp. CA-101289 TaxID=3239893 RepID=UPI003D98CDA0
MEPGADFLAQILKDAPQPVWVLDEDGLIVFANPAAVAALGYDDPSDLYHRHSHDTVHRLPDGSPYPRATCPMQIPRTTGESSHGEYEWFERRDGSLFPVAWWASPIAMTRGRGAVLAFTDISERSIIAQAARERDAAAIRAGESQAAQRRIVEAAATVRRNVARDLHDGAQQRLVNVLISLQLARDEIGDSPRAHHLFDEATGHAQRAIDELREVAAGLHPPILTHGGLVMAVHELATRALLPVTVDGSLPGRLPEVIENNAYFFVAEALTNTTKHAQASQATVAIGVDHDALTVEVRDDGIGGAQTGGGSGLAGLTDRLGALGGRMVLRSPRGRGTTVRAEIPVRTRR